jgi:polyisoprenoid-binding protein YceI
MLKHMAVFAAAVLPALAVLGLDVPSKPASMIGSWQVDARHSDAKLSTEATTDYGKTKIKVALGFARVNGTVKIGDGDATKSGVDLEIYPATSVSPAIDEDGKFLSHWLENLSNHTLLSFHSKRVVRMPDGQLQATGDLTITRLDRNVEVTRSEVYAGPVYGPPVIHRGSHEATFVFDFQTAGGNEQRESWMTSGSMNMLREDFPQLLRTVVSTYWPPVIEDEVCKSTDDEVYDGSRCTGIFMEAPGFPEAPHAARGEDIGVPQHFSAVVGSHLTILVHMHLIAKPSGEQAGARN